MIWRRHPAVFRGVVLLALLTAFFWIAGALSPAVIPVYASSRREVIGMALMLIALPPYFAVTAVLVRRHSLGLLESLRSQVPDPSSIDDARDSVQNGWRRTWIVGAALGFVMGALNTSIIEALNAVVAPTIHMSLSFGQLLLWLSIGIFFADRFNAARAFRHLGTIVELDVYALDRLQPLARSGLADVMVIAGALAFAPLQALDAGFRWYNYQFGVGVAVIASTILLLWPLRPIQRRIREQQTLRLAAVERLIAAADRASNPESIEALESLLGHRDRLRELRTWLLSTNLLSRFFLYLIIPPLAWVGAAIVERWVDRFLTG